MACVLLDQRFPEPLTDDVLREMFDGARGCLGLYRVHREESLLSSDCKRLVCRFRAPDAESVRTALRQADVTLRPQLPRYVQDATLSYWPATVHDAPGMSDTDVLRANVVVNRSFDPAAVLEDVQAIEDNHAHCLEAHRVRFMRTFFSTDRKRMVCLYQAPDAESVRIAQRQATMPFDTVWAFRRLAPNAV